MVLLIKCPQVTLTEQPLLVPIEEKQALSPRASTRTHKELRILPDGFHVFKKIKIA